MKRLRIAMLGMYFKASSVLMMFRFSSCCAVMRSLVAGRFGSIACRSRLSFTKTVGTPAVSAAALISSASADTGNNASSASDGHGNSMLARRGRGNERRRRAAPVTDFLNMFPHLF